VLALGLAAPAGAQTQIWGYIDQNGSGHFASEKLDNRYKLFSVYDAPVRPGRKAVPAAGTGGLRTLASIDASARYQAVSHLIREAASAHGLDVALLKAVVATESGFDPNAVSPKGAVGLMQLMPATAERFGVRAQADQTLQQRLTDPRTNLQAGARYLALLLRQFGGQLDLALAAYNAGEGAVLRAGRQVPNYPETQHYVRSVSQLHQSQSSAQAQTLPLADAAARPLPGGALGRGNLPAAPL
jgi:soluble lytic murein transglycosylase-like protein